MSPLFNRSWSRTALTTVRRLRRRTRSLPQGALLLKEVESALKDRNAKKAIAGLEMFELVVTGLSSENRALIQMAKSEIEDRGVVEKLRTGFFDAALDLMIQALLSLCKGLLNSFWIGCCDEHIADTELGKRFGGDAGFGRKCFTRLVGGCPAALSSFALAEETRRISSNRSPSQAAKGRPTTIVGQVVRPTTLASDARRRKREFYQISCKSTCKTTIGFDTRHPRFFPKRYPAIDFIDLRTARIS